MINNRLFACVSVLFMCTTAEVCAAFLLIMGPSGVGKSTIIHHLKQLDHRFEYVTPFTTRELRDGEVEKVHVSLTEIEELDKAGKLLVVNEFYGVHYATPKYIIDESLLSGKFPVLDWPIEKLHVMQKHYKDNLFRVYVGPDDADELKRRLMLDNRDANGKRYDAGLQEINKFIIGEYDEDIDLKVINKKDSAKEIAELIYAQFINYVNR